MRWFLTLLVTMFFAVTTAHAQPKKPLTSECLKSAAAQYNIHPDVLIAILLVEGGTVGQNTSNTNGTYDIGLFQINSIHLRKLKEFGITETALRNDGCVNAYVAAWHVARTLKNVKPEDMASEQGYLSAIARYHSVTPKYNRRYANRLREAFSRMYALD